MVDLVLCHSIGGCLPLDDVKAAELFKRAADAGNERGQYFSSDEYQQGDGVEQNETEAFSWCLKSAEQEYPPAMARIGEYYYYGFGIEQDFAKAVHWFEKAVSEGIEAAQYHLGLCYENGYGVDQSIKDALKLYTMSARRNEKSQQSLDRMANKYETSAELFDAESIYWLGCYYSYNISDYNKAIQLLEKSAEQGYVESSNDIAWTYHLMGKYEDALPWAKKAVDLFPEDHNIIDTLATVYQGLGRFSEAMEQFNLCLKLKQEQNVDEDDIVETKEKISALKKLMKHGSSNKMRR